MRYSEQRKAVLRCAESGFYYILVICLQVFNVK